MQTKSKLLLIVAMMLLALTTATIINTSLNFRDFSIKSATEKSKLAATIVKNGLTAHMVNGTMDSRHYFLNQISTGDEVSSLWLARSSNVIKQYGKGMNYETIRDAIDQEVLTTGNSVEKIIEDANKILLRVSIPYKATINNGDTNCLSCHNVKIGDTLGVISMEFDISNMRTSGMFTILKILGINILFLLIVLFLLNYYISPYMKLFSNLQNGIKKAYVGDFTHIFETSVNGEAKDIVNHMNTLFSKMQETFGNIKENLGTIIPLMNMSSDNPLEQSKIVINELSDVYKFKKTIELDATKSDVYMRLVQILKLKYNINNFSLYEVNTITNTRTLNYSSNDNVLICKKEIQNDALLCRAFRTKSIILSSEFQDLCQSCIKTDENYLCFAFSINSEVSLIISIIGNSKEDINDKRTYISRIKHYLEAAKPVISSHILMEKLKDTSRRDPMTGLNNRRFLEEIIERIMSQVGRKKEIYSIMMLDIDFFKRINDTYGHDIGDMVIVEIAKVLKNNIRESDLAIRYGGEEFVVILDNATVEGTLGVAKKIHSAFGNLIFDVAPGKTIQKTLSIGISMFSEDADTIWKCIKLADTALYIAKTTGRNKIVKYEKEMSEGADIR
ncbi:GGDEF domain-containing protein [Sulfurimonas sp.]|uniref:GGDEF domain-containing protein n=1 Tax=Sulfurimonas sp. TaxID=2022749 RepID=UPI002B499F7A|nr:GGDEF domain-containing protein [Sulfurimonas sp.]